MRTISVFAATVLLILCTGCFQFGSEYDCKIYYIDKNNKPIAENIQIRPLTGESVYEAVLRKSFNEPSDPRLFSPYIGLRYVSSRRTGSRLLIELAADSVRSGYDPSLVACCLMQTLYGVEGITSVSIHAAGLPLSVNEKTIFTRSDFVVDDLFTLEKTLDIVAYLPDEEFSRLIPVVRSVRISGDETPEEAVILQLENGVAYEKASFSTVPKGMLISAVTFGGICYVDMKYLYFLSLESFSSQTHDIQMSVYSIVNSLCRIDTIKSVQFLSDGEITSIRQDVIDFSHPIQPLEDFNES